jgi:uncharacterized protein (TIGR00297 family)
MAAACIVGAGVAAGSGWHGLTVLLAFFLSSSLLTRDGGHRDAIQVAANGGIATAASLLSRTQPAFALAFSGALAAAAADTWSTEIGGRSTRAPRLITTGRTVEPGTSGGVTWVGSAAGVAGAAFVSGIATLLGVISLRHVAMVALGGIAGGIADSLLGATVQARYRCSACGGLGERPRHSCGQPAILASGVRWMTNDMVNLMATAVGAALPVLPAVLGAASLA